MCRDGPKKATRLASIKNLYHHNKNKHMSIEEQISKLAARLDELRIKADQLSLAEEQEMAEIQRKIEELETKRMR
jgi:small-conductance mechanosensitive channel